MRRIIVFILIVSFAGAAWTQSPATSPAPKLTVFQLLSDPQNSRTVFMALRTIDDKELFVVYVALATHAGDGARLLAIASLVDHPDKDAVKEILVQRLRTDTSMTVRQAALEALKRIDRCDESIIRSALEMPDDFIRLDACRAAVKMNLPQLAEPVLIQLTSSQEAGMAALANLLLVAIGRSESLAVLRKTVESPDTPEEMLALLMDRIADDRIQAASSLAETVALSKASWDVRSKAYRAWVVTSPKGVEALADAITSCDQLGSRVRLCELLADQKDTRGMLQRLAQGHDEVAAVARFELARPAGDEKAAQAADALLAMGHPILAEYLLLRAKQDIDHNADNRAMYVPILLKIIDAAPANMKELRRDHFRSAAAATVLADYGSPEAMDGLRTRLGRSYNGTVRSITTGLLRTKNAGVCDLARPLLESPYRELATDAALLLGRFGDESARPMLQQLAAQDPRQSVMVVTLSQWYLLKMDGKSKEAALELAEILSTSPPATQPTKRR